jgi:hypothetical protein
MTCPGPWVFDSVQAETQIEALSVIYLLKFPGERAIMSLRKRRRSGRGQGAGGLTPVTGLSAGQAGH